MSDFNIELDVVDVNGNIIGHDESKSVHQKHLLHRAVHILIVNESGEIFVRQRSFDKELYAGVWSTSVGEHVKSGQDYNMTAHRALKEFLDLEVNLDHIATVHVEDAIENELVAVYTGKSNDIPLINAQHMEQGRFMKVAEIAELVKNKKTTPHLEMSLDIFLKKES